MSESWGHNKKNVDDWLYWIQQSFIRVLVIQNLAADEEVICWSLLIGYFTRNEASNLRVFLVFFSLTN